MKWTSNFLLLTTYSINGYDIEIVKGNGNSSNHHIYNNNKNNENKENERIIT